MILKHILLSVILTAIYMDAAAQNRPAIKPGNTRRKADEFSKYTLTPFTGLTQFYGELNEQDMKSLAGLCVSRSFSTKVRLGFAYTAGRLGGQKSAFFSSYFINKYNTAELLMRWDLSEQFRGRERPEFHFNVYGGLGLMVFRAQAYDIQTNELLRYTNSTLSARNPLFLKWGPPKGTAGIKNTREGVLPVGLAADYELLDRLSFGFDGRFYFIRTDKADATSGRRLLNPEESTSYSDTPNDKFSFLSVSLTYCFGSPHRR
jgi:hypothetical protein